MLTHQSDDANYLTSPTGGTCDGITCFKKIIAINFFPVNVKYIKAVQKPTKGGWTLNKRKGKNNNFSFLHLPKENCKDSSWRGEGGRNLNFMRVASWPDTLSMASADTVTHGRSTVSWFARSQHKSPTIWIRNQLTFLLFAVWYN